MKTSSPIIKGRDPASKAPTTAPILLCPSAYLSPVASGCTNLSALYEPEIVVLLVAMQSPVPLGRARTVSHLADSSSLRASPLTACSPFATWAAAFSSATSFMQLKVALSEQLSTLSITFVDPISTDHTVLASQLAIARRHGDGAHPNFAAFITDLD